MKLTKRLQKDFTMIIALGVIMSMTCTPVESFGPEESESKTSIEGIITTPEKFIETSIPLTTSEEEPKTEETDDKNQLYEKDFEFKPNTALGPSWVNQQDLIGVKLISSVMHSKFAKAADVTAETEEDDGSTETDIVEVLTLDDEESEEWSETEKTEEPVTESDNQPDYSVIPLSMECIESLISASDENGIDMCVILALIESESGFEIDAVSCCGCYGLMQLHPLYYPTDLTPAENIQYGVATLGKNYEKYQDMRLALDVYGNGHVTNNFKYPDKILRRAEEWRAILTEADIL